MIQTVIASMPMFVCGLFALLLALDLRGRVERRCLLVFFVVATLLYVGHLVFFCRVLPLIPVCDTCYAFCNVAVFPLYYIYIVSLTRRPVSPYSRRMWWTLLPAVACGVAVGVLYACMSPGETFRFVQTYLYGGQRASLAGLVRWQAVAHDVARCVFALQLIPVVTVGRRHVARFNRRVEADYADTDGRAVPTLEVLLWLFVATSVISFVCNVVGRQWFGTTLWLLAVPAVVFSSLLFLVGRAGLRQDFSIIEVMAYEAAADEAEACAAVAPAAPGAFTSPVSAVPDEDSAGVQTGRVAWQKDLIQRIVDERLYLRPDLKLNELALLLGTNRTYLSRAISNETSSTFSDFINRLRIGEAIKLREASPDMPVADIAAQCGFASYSSFHRNFVKFGGKNGPETGKSQASEAPGPS